MGHPCLANSTGTQAELVENDDVTCERLGKPGVNGGVLHGPSNLIQCRMHFV